MGQKKLNIGTWLTGDIFWLQHFKKEFQITCTYFYNITIHVYCQNLWTSWYNLSCGKHHVAAYTYFEIMLNFINYSTC